MKKFLLFKNKAVILLALAAFAAGGIAGGFAVNTAMAPLKARILHLEAVARAGGVTEQELEAWEQRVDQLEKTVPASSERIQALMAKVAKLEARLPYPVVGADTLADHMGEDVALYGTISRVTKSASGHLFIDVSGKATVVWFGCPYGKQDLGLDVGDGIVAVGTVKEYNGKPEVMVSGRDQLFIGD